MLNKNNKIYCCKYCHKQYKDEFKADVCLEDHELIYVALSKTDLNRLINFLYLKDDSLLTNTLVESLNKYLRGN